MAQYLSPSEISSWIPVIAALLGATVVFVGNLINLQFTNKHKVRLEREDRERDRLESMYEILIAIRIDYQGMLGQVISKVHFDTPINPKEYSDTPPIIRLNMVIHMYFQSLSEAHKQFVSAQEAFGEKYAANISTSFVKESTEAKQRICGEYAKLFKEIDSEISKLQKQLALMVKA